MGAATAGCIQRRVLKYGISAGTIQGWVVFEVRLYSSRSSSPSEACEGVCNYYRQRNPNMAAGCDFYKYARATHGVNGDCNEL